MHDISKNSKVLSLSLFFGYFHVHLRHFQPVTLLSLSYLTFYTSGICKLSIHHSSSDVPFAGKSRM